MMTTFSVSCYRRLF